MNKRISALSTVYLTRTVCKRNEKRTERNNNWNL